MSAKPLHPFHLSGDCKLAHPQRQPQIEVDSPASRIILDFRLHPVPTLFPDTPLVEAQHFLNYSHSSVLLVVDRQDQLCGIATNQCLSEQSVIKLVSQGRSRSEIQVGDLMQSRQSLSAVTLQEIGSTTVGEVLSLLRHEGLTLVLVIDDQTNEVTGVLSAVEIEQILDLKLDVSHNPSFLDIFNAVMH